MYLWKELTLKVTVSKMPTEMTEKMNGDEYLDSLFTISNVTGVRSHDINGHIMDLAEMSCILSELYWFKAGASGGLFP
jgi:hypothetical protein